MENPTKRIRVSLSCSKIRVISSEVIHKPKIKESSGRVHQFVAVSDDYMQLIAY